MAFSPFTDRDGKNSKRYYKVGNSFVTGSTNPLVARSARSLVRPKIDAQNLKRPFEAANGYNYNKHENLILWANFNESNQRSATIADLSGKSHAISLFNSGASGVPKHSLDVPFQVAKPYQSTARSIWCNQNGVGVSTKQFIKVVNSSNLSFGNGSSDSAFSIQLWVSLGTESEPEWKFSTSQKNQALFGKYDTLGVNDKEYRAFISSTGSIEWALFDNSVGSQIFAETQILTGSLESGWHHLLFTYDGSSSNKGMKIYYDGDLNMRSSGSKGSYTAMEVKNSSLDIGAWARAAATNYLLKGKIAEFAVWNVELSADDAKALYGAAHPNYPGMDTSEFDEFRQGVSVLSDNHRAVRTLPTIGAFSSDHVIEERTFGQGKEFKDEIVIKDMQHLKMYTRVTESYSGYYVTSAYGGAITYLKNDNIEQYPLVFNNISFTDPMHMNGVIEPLSIRGSIGMNSVEVPYAAHTVRASLFGGDERQRLKGVANIYQTYLISGTTKTSDPFVDAADTFFAHRAYFIGSGSASGSFLGAKTRTIGADGVMHTTQSWGGMAIPGLISDLQLDIVPYDDAQVRKEFLVLSRMRPLVSSGSNNDRKIGPGEIHLGHAYADIHFGPGTGSDGDKIGLEDSRGKKKVFEFDRGNGVDTYTSGNIRVNIFGGNGQKICAAEFYQSVNRAYNNRDLDIFAVKLKDTVVRLIQGVATSSGNTVITWESGDATTHLNDPTNRINFNWSRIPCFVPNIYATNILAGATGSEQSGLKFISGSNISDFEKVLKMDQGLISETQKSAGAGFTYFGNTLGTDSIAFGGLKKG